MNRRTLLASALPTGVLPLAAGSAIAHVDPEARKGARPGPYRLSVAAYSYRQLLQAKPPKMDLFDLIRTCAEMGSDGVELTEYYFPRPIEKEYLLRLRHAMQLWGVTLTGTPIGNRFTLPRGEEREKQIAAYREWVEVSSILGSPAIRTFAGSAPAGVDEAEARRWVVECLEEVCEFAGERGIFVGLENHGGVVAGPDGLLEIVKAVKSPWLGVNLDTGNFRTDDPYADVARCAPYAITVQYKVEVTPRGKPTQPADFPRVVRILREAGYRGFITLEYEAREDPVEAVPRHLAEMRRVLVGSA